MLKSDNKKGRKTRSDKFPLTLHKTGQFCKKIRGKLYYFGNDKKLALQRYLEDAAYLHSAKSRLVRTKKVDMSLRYLCNLFIEHQQSRADTGQIKKGHIYWQTVLLKDFVRFIGTNRMVSDIVTLDVQNYIRKQIKDEKSTDTINNRIATVKAMYNWALENEVIINAPNLKAIKKITKVKTEKPFFTAEEINMLIQYADVQIKAMIWLGLNCGFGCTDCAELKWDNLDLKNSRVIFPRGKTGISRNLLLWPETVKAIQGIPKQGVLVFYTAKGNPWVRTIQSKDKSGNDKFTKDDAVTKQFSKLLKKSGIKTEKGVGFYTLRRTAATLAARSGDPFAVQKLLGHADLKMASVYVQDVSAQTDRVVDNVRKLILSNESVLPANSTAKI